MAIMQFSRAEEIAYLNYERGREEGIKSSIEIGAKYGVSKGEIVKVISEQFNLTTEEASDYVEEYFPD